MNPTLQAMVQSAARHVTTAGGGGLVIADPMGGPTFLGLTAGQWQGLAVFLAGLVVAIMDKMPARQP